MTNVLLQAVEMHQFFGRPTNQVNNLLLRIAMKEQVEWLRGKYRLQDLPRFNLMERENVVEAKIVKPTDLSEQIRWVVEELGGIWCLSYRGFSFDSASEALHFKMRWS